MWNKTLIKDINDLYTKLYISLLRGILEDLDKWNYISILLFYYALLYYILQILHVLQIEVSW